MIDHRIELTVPANKDMMLVLRLTTAGVVARAGLGVDRINDVKMAVEEACSLMMENTASEEIHLTFEMQGEELIIRAHTRCSNCSCLETDEMQVARCILESMVDKVEICHTDAGVGMIVLHVALGM